MALTSRYILVNPDGSRWLEPPQVPYTEIDWKAYMQEVEAALPKAAKV